MEEADLSVDKPADPPPPDPVPSSPASASTSSAKKRRRYQQRHLPFAPPPKITPPATPAPVVEAERPLAPTSAEMKAKAYLAAQKKYTSDWHGRFPWLVLDKTDDGSPCLRCSVCMQHGKPTARYGRDGPGGRDLQIGSMRWHEESTKHEACVQKQAHLDKEIESQKRMDDFAKNDPDAARVIRLLRSMLFICKEDAPISMFTRLIGHLSQEGVKDIPKQTYGAYITKYGFREMVKAMVAFLKAQQMEHIHSSPFIGISCDESTDRTRGKHLIVFGTFLKKRRVVTEFLSLLTIDKCDAASLQSVLLGHLEGSGIELQKIAGISTDGASVMTGEKNGLVARLRLRIPHLVGCHCIAHREALAVKDASNSFPDLFIVDVIIRAFGEIVGRSTPWILGAVIVVFIEYKHKHVALLKSFKFHFCLNFLADILAELNTLNRFFQRRTNMALFDNKLPGVELRAMELELKTFCHIMKTHRKDDDFAQGLANMKKTKDWSKSYPNLMRMWQALAVLPLSTVECERGFSRQNVIKGWHRTSLCDATLGELMTISMLDYDMDYPQIVEKWRRIRHRRQATNVEFEQEIPLFPQQKDVVESSDDESVGGGSEDDNVDDDY
ncbi:hypothetical protein CLOP_g14608 [Closterium sp. NIES-67]|nr:hypothetical protein CLOP_g14608 [Closterium sp. NIES-67]